MYNKFLMKNTIMDKEIVYINYSAPKNKNNCSNFYSNIISISEKFLQKCYNIFLFLVRVFLAKIYGKGEHMTKINDPIIMESVTSLSQKIRSKQLKSINVVKAYIKRIKEINPMLNCVVDDRFEEALIDAYNADKLIESQKYTETELLEKKPLLGIPFTTKDSIQIKNMQNTGGLWLRRNHKSNENAKSIKLLQEAGAIPLALTNVPELCMWWETNNTLFGRTNNPYDSNRTVGGSSGGEGCIQAAGGSPFGLGSDIGGSIRMPALFNGIFGHKPSKFIVSNHGQFPPVFSKEQDSFLGIGPMCRYATDLKLVLKVIAGEKAKDLNLDTPVNLKNVKIFYQLDDGEAPLVQQVETPIRVALLKAIKHLKEKFGETPKCVQFEKFRESTDIWFANMKDPKDIGLDQQLANFEGIVNPYVEFVKCLFGRSKHTLIGITNAIIERFQAKHGTSSHSKYVAKRDELLQEIQDLLKNNGVLLYPTHPTVAPYHWEPVPRIFNFSYTAIINCMGLPSTAIPLGIGKEGLPLGIQVIANHNQDRLCLAVAEELEKAFGGWVSVA